jgi:SAM-dependent methyltransferase
MEVLPLTLKDAIITIYKTVCRLYLTPLLFYEWKKPLFNNINERVIEYEFALRSLSKLCGSEVLDVGTGSTAWPHILAHCGFRVTAIDKMSYSKSGFFNRHYYVVNNDITKPTITRKFDIITCISVLEHIKEHDAAVRGMFSLLRFGGHLILTFPYNERMYINNVYELPNAGYGKNKPYICQVFSRKEIEGWMKENCGRIINQEYYEVFTGDLWTFGNRIYPPRQVTKDEKHHLTCLLVQKAGRIGSDN